MPNAPDDLLEVAEAAAVRFDGADPGWARSSWAAVRWWWSGGRRRRRMARCRWGCAGATRDQRLAGWLAPNAVRRHIRPEDLAVARAWVGASCAALLPHFAVLVRIDAWMGEAGLVWGPAGSAGFELAGGLPCLTAASDIDIAIRARPVPPIALAARLVARLADLPVRIDGQMETPLGWVALAEYAARPRRIVVRAAAGPDLRDNPWKDDTP